jgi:hypothetical protein
VRTAAFTTLDAAADVGRLATTYDVDLVVVDAPPSVDADRVPDGLARLLEQSPADVAVLCAGEPGTSGRIVVPFGGGEHDWAALELAAWLATGLDAQLGLLGTSAEPRTGRRDASRLLADASLAVQRAVGISSEPLLARPDDESLVEAVADAALVVVGISPRWRQDGSRTRYTWTLGSYDLQRAPMSRKP